jgi:hypothetical protein
MWISYYAKVYDLLPERRTVAWPDFFRDWHEADSEDDKKQIPLFSCDLFKPFKGREKGLTRGNVDSVSGLLLDYDDDHGVSIEQAESCWADYEYFLHTTYSHQVPGVWKDAFRMLLPFPEPVTVAEYEAFLKGWALPFAAGRNAKFKPLSVGHPGYFLPTRRPGASSEYHRYNEGPRLTPRTSVPVATASTVTPSGALLHIVRPPPPLVLPSEPLPVPADIFRGMETAHEVADLSTLEPHCSFLRFGRESAANLSEPEWRSWLSLVVRCRGGRAEAHAVSSADPRYQRGETETKIDRLLTESGPHSCEHIESQTSRGGCSTCPLRGKIKNPLAIQKLVEDTGATSTDEVVEGADRAQQKVGASDELRDASDRVSAARLRVAELKLREAAHRRAMKKAATVGALVGDDTELLQLQMALEAAKVELSEAQRALRSESTRARARESLADPHVETLNSLTTDDRGVVLASKLNIHRILTTDPAYAGRFSFDTFSFRVLYDNVAAEDHREVQFTLDLERRYGLRVETRTFREVAWSVAHQREFHPVVDYLRSLEWDGQDRLDRLMTAGFGAKVTGTQPNSYLADVGRKLGISAVARVLAPHKKNEVVVVAIGKQGKKKSSGFKALCKNAEWFGDGHLPIQSKEAFMAIQGKWIWEIAEMDSFRKSEATAIKSFISSQSDTYRPPYGANTITRLRNTIFVATTNDDELFDDPTGTRRFAPVETGDVNEAWIRFHVDQLWAEAVVRFDREERWWYEAEEAENLSKAGRAFHQVDVWTDLILEKIFDATNPPCGLYSAQRILLDWLGASKDKIGKRESHRVSDIMKYLGIEPSRIQGLKQQKRYGASIGTRGYIIDDETRKHLSAEFRANVLTFQPNTPIPDEVF